MEGTTWAHLAHFECKPWRTAPGTPDRAAPPSRFLHRVHSQQLTPSPHACTHCLHRLLALQNADEYQTGDVLEIRVSCDKEKQTITIECVF